jgi:3',5'-cyclic AMP phosphodiesterase CpdA
LSDPFTIIHVSDLHFHRLPRRPGQWLSKRGLGGLNLLLRRARLHPRERYLALVRRLDGMDWDHLVITGDLTQLALEEEFALARETLAPLLARGAERVTVIPGNHDRYVPEPPGQDAFKSYFGEFFGNGEIATRTLNGRWRLVGWDSSYPAPYFRADGRVRPETLAATERWLEKAPGLKPILANHFPLYFMPPFGYRAHHELQEIETVRDWLNGHGVELYLHGHIHRNWVLAVTENGRTSTHVNSASSTRLPRREDRSAFHRIVLSGDQFEVQPLPLD